MNNATADVTAGAIFNQIEDGVKMSLGMHNPSVIHTPSPGLTFLVRILPFRKDGTRGLSARVMRVTITQNPSGWFDVLVSYQIRRAGDKIHFKRTDVHPKDLNELMLALDYDGLTILNPRWVI